MAMIAGHYITTLTPNHDGGTEFNIGSTELGFDVIVRPGVIPVRDDYHGRSIIDFISCGIEEMAIRIRSLKFSATGFRYALRALDNALLGASVGTLAHAPGEVINTFPSDAKATFTLRLIPATGYRYVVGQPNVFQFALAYPVEDVNLLLSSTRLFTIPFGLRIMPTIDEEDGSQVWFTMENVPVSLPAEP